MTNVITFPNATSSADVICTPLSITFPRIYRAALRDQVHYTLSPDRSPYPDLVEMKQVRSIVAGDRCSVVVRRHQSMRHARQPRPNKANRSPRPSMFCKLIGSTRRKAEISRKERRLKDAEVLDGVALDHLKLGEALLTARESNTDLASAIAASLGWDGLTASMAAASSVVRPDRSDEFDELIERYKSLRKLGRLMFRTFSFRSFRADDTILAAVAHLRAHVAKPA